MLERMETSETEYALSLRVTGLNVDPNIMLRTVGLKIPSDYATTRSQRQPVTKHAWNDNTQLPITNLSESNDDPASSADFFVVANIPDIFSDKATLDALDDAGRQSWLQSHWSQATEPASSRRPRSVPPPTLDCKHSIHSYSLHQK